MIFLYVSDAASVLPVDTRVRRVALRTTSRKGRRSYSNHNTTQERDLREH
jgi:endonuclease III